MTAGRLKVGRREGIMAQTDAASTTSTPSMTSTTSGGVGVWIFRVLLVAGAAFMLYSWFQPWWSADVAVIKGENDMVLRPWGVEAVARVRNNMDESAFQMPFPQVFAGFMWVYLVVCMLLLAASLFVTKRIKLGPINVSVAMLLILFVGLSYAIAVGLALGIGVVKAQWAGANFIGKSNVLEPQTGARLKMTSDLLIGYWLALGAGGVLTLIGLVRPLFVRKPKVS
jgi:hypothetical protein